MTPDGIRIRVRLSQALKSNGQSFFVSRAHNFERLIAKSTEIYDVINDIVGDSGPFCSDSFARPYLAEPLNTLNIHLYGMRFSPSNQTLREILEEVVMYNSAPVISVNELIGLIPWEITTPFPHEPSRMLGATALVYGSLSSEPENGGGSEAKVGRVIDSGFSTVRYDRCVRLRGAGDTSLASGENERDLVLRPQANASGLIAPGIRSAIDECAFFSHFNHPEYSIVHFFCHCGNDQTGFELRVDQHYGLHEVSFYANKASFRPGAVHFLNVCGGAPTPATQRSSLVGYMAGEQMAGAIIASLTSVRSVPAYEMARAFYEHFIPGHPNVSGKSIARALFEARAELWKRDLAAGYLYRTFGRHDVRLTPVAGPTFAFMGAN